MVSQHPSPNERKETLSATSNPKFDWPRSHHAMPKVLVFKAQDVM